MFYHVAAEAVYLLHWLIAASYMFMAVLGSYKQVRLVPAWFALLNCACMLVTVITTVTLIGCPLSHLEAFFRSRCGEMVYEGYFAVAVLECLHIPRSEVALMLASWFTAVLTGVSAAKALIWYHTPYTNGEAQAEVT